MSTCDVQQLLTDGKCFSNACLTPGQQRIALLQLLCEIANSAGGGGVTSIIAGAGISVDAATGDVTITNTGVLSAIAGTGIGVSGASGNVTFTNTGVTSLVAGNGITISGGTGAVTVTAKALNEIPTATGAIDFGAQTIANFKSVVNQQTGTTYTVAASDCGKVIQFTNGSAVTFTVNTDLPDGGSVSVIQSGAGQVTVSPSGLTIRNNSGYTKTAAQYAAITLLRIGTDLYLTGEGA